MTFQFNDGGRAAAGYKGQAGDCVTRAIAIITGLSYQEVYDKINHACKTTRKKKSTGSSARTGVAKSLSRKLLAEMGYQFTPTMGIGTGCRVHLRADELPAGRIICQLSGHLVAVIDGVIYDTYDCSRGGTRCVYGYYSQSK